MIYRTSRVDESSFPVLLEELGKRLDGLATDAPIPYRRQNGGDYEIPALTLRPELAPGETGAVIHLLR